MNGKLIQATKQEFLDRWSGPEMFYKYRKWVTPRDKEILSKREIYLSKFSQFHSDDPDEGKLRLDYSGMDRNTLAKQIFRHPQNEGINRRERKANAKRAAKTSPVLNKGQREKILESFFVPWDEGRGVFCVSARNDNEMMWNKFGDSGAGICIAFSFRKLLDFFSICQPIEYQEVLPKISANSFFDMAMNSYDAKRIISVMDNRYRTKLKTFEDEEEFRFVSVSIDKPLEQRKLVLPESTFLNVYTGPNMPIEKRIEVSQACYSGNIDVELIKNL